MRLILLLAAASFLAAEGAAENLTIRAGGRVSIELIGSDADFHNTLSIVSPSVAVAARGCSLESFSGLPGVAIVSEKSSKRGCRVELDANPSLAGVQEFPAGTKFEFNMCAQADSDADCEHVWSSDPAHNTDHFDHVMTTDLHTTSFPGQIFRMAWEDIEGGGDFDFNDLIVVVRVAADSDGDGLWDDWEMFGIDTNGDGIIDLDLPNTLPVDLNGDGDTDDPGERTSASRKDIFLEIDYMDCAQPGADCAVGDTHSHRPLAAGIEAAVQAFNRNGVTLHVQVGNAVLHQKFLSLGCFGTLSGVGEFDEIKSRPENFGVNNPRRFAFHYAIYGHQQGPTGFPAGSSGCAEVSGNDLLLTLGSFAGGVGTAQEQANTLMHELGHNLNLRHGGGDSVNYKPNYLSVMNYSFQFSGILPSTGSPTGRLDYSSSNLAELDENSLDESLGIGSLAGIDTLHTCPGSTTLKRVSAAGAIDWDCDGPPTPIDTLRIASSINMDSTRQVLRGYNDWANVKYDFQNDTDFEDGSHTSTTNLVEIDYITSLRVRFDVLIQDDTTNSAILINSATGEYQFTKCGPGGFVLSGFGAVVKRGCGLTFQHNSPDRRIQASFDECLKKGNSSVQYLPTGTTITITDRNTNDNSLTCQ
jgi:hypothetical protein